MVSEAENEPSVNAPPIGLLKSLYVIDVLGTFHWHQTRHIRRAIQIAFIVISQGRLRRGGVVRALI